MGLDLKLAGFNRDSTVAYYLAKAGIKRATAVIQNEDHKADYLAESWSRNDEATKPLFKDIKISDIGTFTVSYPFSDNRLFYGIQDEDRRVNINSAPKEVIGRLIAYLYPASTNSEEVALNIVNWRTSGLTIPDDYLQEGYSRKGAAFDSVDEVLLVKGMDQQLFNAIKDYITVYPIDGNSKINVNTAPLPVLVAMGFNESDADKIVSGRPGPDDEEERQPFDPVSFPKYLSDNDINSSGINSSFVSYGSQYFRIISTGSSLNGRANKKITCVVSAPAGETVFWSEE